jgi:LCP family protein required for cell wall assembly
VPGQEPSPPQHLASARRSSRAGRFQDWRKRRKARLATRSTLRKALTRSGIVLLVLLVVIVGGGVGYYYYRADQVHHEAAPHLVTTKGPIENILLIGSTSRCAAAAIARYRRECERGVTGVNSDVVLVARLNARTHSVSLLSIPRDTFVPGARSGSALCGTTSPLTPGTCPNKIDAALVEGPDQLIQAIEQDYGIPINHFVDLNFYTFTNVVNALGGLKMYFPDRLFDASSGLRITKTGCQVLNGTQALALVRSRHLYYFTKGQTPNYTAIQAATTPTGPWYTPDSGGSYDGTGDLGRIVRVHLFLKALAQQVAARGLGNPITDNSLIGAVAPNLTVDKSFSTLEMLHLALDFRHVNFGASPEVTMPTLTYAQPYTYDGASYGDVIFPIQPEDQQVVERFLGDPPPRTPPSSISVSVIDGTGSATQTAQVASKLNALGYKIVPTTASNDVGPVSEAVVLYRPGHLAQAERVLSSLAGMAILGQGVPVAGADVSVITGSDLAVAAPARPAGNGATSSGSTSTTQAAPTASAPAAPTTPAAGNPNYGYNPATSPIPAWDPRSCPAH